MICVIFHTPQGPRNATGKYFWFQTPQTENMVKYYYLVNLMKLIFINLMTGKLSWFREMASHPLLLIHLSIKLGF